LILASANYNSLNGAAGEPLVVHCSSSQLNRVKIWDIVEILKANAQFNASDKQQKTPSIFLTTSPLLYKSLFFFTQALPVKILAKISTMPVIGNQKLEARAKTFARLIDKMNSMQGLFLHFTNNEFIYDSTNSQKIWNAMALSDRALCRFNVKDINWAPCLVGYLYGIRRFYLKEDIMSPASPW